MLRMLLVLLVALLVFLFIFIFTLLFCLLAWLHNLCFVLSAGLQALRVLVLCACVHVCVCVCVCVRARVCVQVFGYPGGAILPVFDAIHASDRFNFTLPRHEQV